MLATRLGRWSVWALVLIPPFLVSPTAEDSFRLPKLAASEMLALLSLLALAAGWWSRREISLADLARRPATAFALLLATAILPGAVWAVHPLHWQRAATSLVIALGCLVIWSARLGERTLRRALDLLTFPAAALALLAVLQAHRIFRPFAFAQGQAARYDITSLAGSVGDLGSYLILPALALQAGLARGGSRLGRGVRGVLLALVVYALVSTQTLAALAAAGVASLVLWAILLPPRRLWLAAVPLVAGAGAVMLVPDLMRRLDQKLDQLRDLRLDSLLTGRLDGWKTALEMFRQHLWLGVGHGGYGSSFATAKLALVERGVPFWSAGTFSHFVNAHNEYLEALAEWGLLGLAAMVAAGLVLTRRLRDLWRTAPLSDRALAWSGCAALLVIALASFPLRMALTGYPWVLFMAWIFAVPDPSRRDSRAHGRAAVPAWTWSAALCLLLAAALVVHGRALHGRLEASRIVRTTSQVAQLAMRSGAEAARPVLQTNLRHLRRAAELDPLQIGVPITTGSHYFLLGNPSAAIEAYERGLAIEPRATLYLNLGRALLLGGRREEGMARLTDAVALDRWLEREANELGWRNPRPDQQEGRRRER